jgi:hypothetical protein
MRTCMCASLQLLLVVLRVKSMLISLVKLKHIIMFASTDFLNLSSNMFEYHTHLNKTHIHFGRQKLFKNFQY